MYKCNDKEKQSYMSQMKTCMCVETWNNIIGQNFLVDLIFHKYSLFNIICLYFLLIWSDLFTLYTMIFIFCFCFLFREIKDYIYFIPEVVKRSSFTSKQQYKVVELSFHIKWNFFNISWRSLKQSDEHLLYKTVHRHAVIKRKLALWTMLMGAYVSQNSVEILGRLIWHRIVFF